jgi:hypothetical protein
MIDFLSVKNEAASERIHAECGTMKVRDRGHLPGQPNQLSQLYHLWVRANLSTSKNVMFFHASFLYIWYYSLPGKLDTYSKSWLLLHS